MKSAHSAVLVLVLVVLLDVDAAMILFFSLYHASNDCESAGANIRSHTSIYCPIVLYTTLAHLESIKIILTDFQSSQSTTQNGAEHLHIDIVEFG